MKIVSLIRSVILLKFSFCGVVSVDEAEQLSCISKVDGVTRWNRACLGKRLYKIVTPTATGCRKWPFYTVVDKYCASKMIF